MALFRRKTDSTQTPGLENYYEQPSGWRLWVRRIVGVVAVLLLIALLIWAASWVYGSVTDDGAQDTNTTEEAEQDSSLPDVTDENDDATNGSTNDDAADAPADDTNTDNEATDNDDQQTDTSDDNTPEALPSTGG